MVARKPDRDVFLAPDSSDIVHQLKALGPVDIVVGIPSFNEADCIAHVVRQADIGVREYFSGSRGVIVNVDNNSPDGTREAFLTAGSRTPQVYISTPEGLRGKGRNFYNLLHAARLLDAKAVVAVDADLISITPQWIRNLASPMLELGCDYITPVYARNEYDGSITNHICYPLLYGLLGKDIRQPIGGDFGLSVRFARHLLERKWQESTFEYGIDIFMTVNALLGDFTVAQTTLGAKVHKPSAPKLGPMFSQVVNTLFSYLVRHPDRWSLTGQAQKLPRLDGIEVLEPQGLALDYKAIKRTALHQYESARGRLARYLATESNGRLEDLVATGRMRLGPTLWSHLVYDLLHSFGNGRGRARAAVVEALKAVFFLRAASFYRGTLDMDHAESESKIEMQARVFRRERKYLSGKA
jgi:glycosyltransferase involved in cell wall biosynthesis